LLEAVQAIGQDVGGYPLPRGEEVGIARRADHHRPQQQQGPLVADYVERRSYGASGTELGHGSNMDSYLQIASEKFIEGMARRSEGHPCCQSHPLWPPRPR